MSKPTPKTATVKFSNGETLELPYRHFCGGSSIKLPRGMAGFRRQWTILGGCLGQYTLGRYDVIEVTFHR